MHRKLTPQIARIAVNPLKVHKSRSTLLQCIKNQYMYLFKSLEILLKNNKMLKNATVFSVKA